MQYAFLIYTEESLHRNMTQEQASTAINNNLEIIGDATERGVFRGMLRLTPTSESVTARRQLGPTQLHGWAIHRNQRDSWRLLSDGMQRRERGTVLGGAADEDRLLDRSGVPACSGCLHARRKHRKTGGSRSRHGLTRWRCQTSRRPRLPFSAKSGAACWRP